MTTSLDRGGLARTLEHARGRRRFVDRNPYNLGRSTQGTHVPLLPERIAVARPGYVWVVAIPQLRMFP